MSIKRGPNKKTITMKKVAVIILHCLMLTDCSGALGTYNEPIMPESASSEDKQNAEVFFYQTDKWVSSTLSPDVLWVALINRSGPGKLDSCVSGLLASHFSREAD